MIRREKLTIFLDATEETTVLQLKKKLEPIVKQSPDHIGLYNQRTDAKESLPDQKTLGDCGYKSGNSKAQDPAPMGMVFWTGDKFEDPIVTPYSSPPELPDVMKPQDAPGALPE
eukprot:Em0015g878a